MQRSLLYPRAPRSGILRGGWLSLRLATLVTFVCAASRDGQSGLRSPSVRWSRRGLSALRLSPAVRIRPRPGPPPMQKRAGGYQLQQDLGPPRSPASPRFCTQDPHGNIRRGQVSAPDTRGRGPSDRLKLLQNMGALRIRFGWLERGSIIALFRASGALRPLTHLPHH